MHCRLKLVLTLGLILIVGFSCSYLPSEKDLVEGIFYQETPDYISLVSGNGQNEIGFMFLPGGLVDPHAYLTLMEKIANDSITVIIPKFPSNLAILDLSKYQNMFDEFPNIASWYIGGHSLGGIAALSAVANTPEYFKGLILLGVYPNESFAIPDWNMQVLSIYAEYDQLSTIEEVEAAVSYLPPALFIDSISDIDTLSVDIPHTIYYCISGGNHSQFGDYGHQDSDGSATISSEQQHEIIHDLIMTFIEWNENE